MGRALIVVASLAVLTLTIAAPATAAARPQVICISNTSSVETPEGHDLRRPSSCNLHARGQPAADAYMVEMRGIHWLNWGGRVAVGKGKSLVNMVGLVYTKVKLSAPKTVCGHRIFTQARFRGHRGGYGPPMQLDRRLATTVCPVALGPP